MKKVYVISISLLLLLACSTRKKFDPEEYRQKQVEYEERKTEINKVKGEFYRENKELLGKMLLLCDELKDTNNKFNDVLADSTFYKGDVIMKPINFGIVIGTTTKNSTSKPLVSVVFINKKGESSFRDPFEELRTCIETKVDVECIKLEDKKLEKIVNLKYAFIVEDLLRIEPELKEDEFIGGLYFCNIICYDIENRRPILTFMANAANSESVQINTQFGQTAKRKIKQDLQLNINRAILESCEKHFKFADNIHFTGFM